MFPAGDTCGIPVITKAETMAPPQIGVLQPRPPCQRMGEVETDMAFELNIGAGKDDDELAAGFEDARDFRQREPRGGYVLEDLVRDHDVERAIVKRDASILNDAGMRGELRRQCPLPALVIAGERVRAIDVEAARSAERDETALATSN